MKPSAAGISAGIRQICSCPASASSAQPGKNRTVAPSAGDSAGSEPTDRMRRSAAPAGAVSGISAIARTFLTWSAKAQSCGRRFPVSSSTKAEGIRRCPRSVPLAFVTVQQITVFATVSASACSCRAVRPCRSTAENTPAAATAISSRLAVRRRNMAMKVIRTRGWPLFCRMDGCSFLFILHQPAAGDDRRGRRGDSREEHERAAGGRRQRPRPERERIRQQILRHGGEQRGRDARAEQDG